MNEQTLRRKTFDELYKLYDECEDISMKQVIHKIVDSKSIDIEDIDFNPYPTYSNPNFQREIFEKQEFNANQLYLDTTEIQDFMYNGFYYKTSSDFPKIL